MSSCSILLPALVNSFDFQEYSEFVHGRSPFFSHALATCVEIDQKHAYVRYSTISVGNQRFIASTCTGLDAFVHSDRTSASDSCHQYVTTWTNTGSFPIPSQRVLGDTHGYAEWTEYRLAH